MRFRMLGVSAIRYGKDDDGSHGYGPYHTDDIYPRLASEPKLARKPRPHLRLERRAHTASSGSDSFGPIQPYVAVKLTTAPRRTANQKHPENTIMKL